VLTNRLASRLIGCSVAIGMLAGCGGSQSASGLPSTMQSDSSSKHKVGIHRRSGSATAFTVSGRKILLNGAPFFIKGVDYGNTQIDAYADPNPLDDANEPVWSPDLDAMRAAGANAVKVYNVNLDSFKPYLVILGDSHRLRPYESGKIGKFLKKAWNGGDRPIYVVLSIFFGGVDVNQPKFRDALKAVYGLMTTEYAADPAVMGVGIGSEINSESLIGQPLWWKNLNEISDSINKAFKDVGAEKITTTTMVDDGLKTVRAGELAKFKVDAWGLDVYRGRTMGRIFDEIAAATSRPEIMAEYGASGAYYPPSSARYDSGSGRCDGYPPGTKDKPYYGLPPPKPWDLATELPNTGNPRMDFLVSYVRSNATEIFDNRASNGGVTSGGFYFEWNDEWWKSGWPFNHIGGFEGNVIIANADFPGCYDDQAWFGLNSDKRNGTGGAFPKRDPDTRVPRPTLDTIKSVWAK
jgi:hypothetical protein